MSIFIPVFVLFMFQVPEDYVGRATFSIITYLTVYMRFFAFFRRVERKLPLPLPCRPCSTVLVKREWSECRGHVMGGYFTRLVPAVGTIIDQRLTFRNNKSRWDTQTREFNTECFRIMKNIFYTESSLLK